MSVLDAKWLQMAYAMIGLLLCFSSAPLRANALELPAEIYAPSSEWVLLQPSASRTYSFMYHHNQNADKPSEVLVQLESDSPGIFDFQIIRADTMALIGHGASLSKQTGQSKDATKLVWAGRATETIEFRVIVSNNHNFPSAYRLSIQGSAIFFPSALLDSVQHDSGTANSHPELGNPDVNNPDVNNPDVNNPDVNNPQSQLISTRIGPIPSKSGIKKLPAADSSAPGSSPDRALPMDGGWTIVDGNQALWYSFQHTGDETMVNVQLDTEVPDALGFQVMTSRMKIFGASIPKDRVTNVASDDSRLIWSSQTLISDLYFIEVRNTSAFPVRYKIEISR